MRKLRHALGTLVIQTLGGNFPGVKITPLEDEVRVLTPEFEEYRTLMKVLWAAGGYSWGRCMPPTEPGAWLSSWAAYSDDTYIKIAKPLMYGSSYPRDEGFGDLKFISLEKFYNIEEIPPEKVGEVARSYDRIAKFFKMDKVFY